MSFAYSRDSTKSLSLAFILQQQSAADISQCLSDDDTLGTPNSAPEAGSLAALDSCGAETKLVRENTLRVVYCSLSYALLFTAFNVAQSFVTTLYPKEGFTSLALIYANYAVCSFISTIVGERLGMRKTIWIGGIFYSLYVISLNIHYSAVPMLLISVLVGFGAGFMWIHQSLFLARACALTGPKYVGYLTGLFFMVFNVNGVLGNLIAMGSLSMGLSVDSMIWIMVALCGVAIVMLWFIDTMDSHFPQTGAMPPFSLVQLCSDIKKNLDVTKTRYFSSLTLYMIAQGANASFIYGCFPKAVPSLQGPYLIPQLFLCFGLSAIIWSAATGKIYDKKGWKPLVWCYAVALIATYAGLYKLSGVSVGESGSLKPLGAMLLIAFLFAFIDNLANAIVNMTIVSAFENSGPAFTVYRLFYCFGNASASVISLWLSLGGMAALNILLGLAATVSFVLVYRNAPANIKQLTKPAQTPELTKQISLKQIKLQKTNSKYQVLSSEESASESEILRSNDL